MWSKPSRETTYYKQTNAVVILRKLGSSKHHVPTLAKCASICFWTASNEDFYKYFIFAMQLW